MTTLPHLAAALQSVFNDTANAAARCSGFIKRVRAFTGAQFVQTLGGPELVPADYFTEESFARIMGLKQAA